MAGRLDPDVKTLLREHDLMPEYEERKKQYVNSGHHKAAEARELAIADIFEKHGIPDPRPKAEQTSAVEFGVTKADFAHGRNDVTELEVVRWVVNNWILDDVTPADAPNAGAWAYRTMCRTSPAFRETFLRDVAGKLLPSRTEVTNSMRTMDVGAAPLRILSKIKALKDRVDQEDEKNMDVK